MLTWLTRKIAGIEKETAWGRGRGRKGGGGGGGGGGVVTSVQHSIAQILPDYQGRSLYRFPEYKEKQVLLQRSFSLSLSLSPESDALLPVLTARSIHLAEEDTGMGIFRRSPEIRLFDGSPGSFSKFV